MKDVVSNTITDKELRQSYWFITHKGKLYRQGIHALFSIALVILFFALIQFTGYLYYALVRDTRIVRPLRDLVQHPYEVIALESPLIIAQGVVSHGNGVFDLYAIIENPHVQWRAGADVVFLIDGVAEQPVQTTIFPADRKYVLKLGIISTASPKNVSVRIENISWKRLDMRDRALLAHRERLHVSDINVRSGRTETGALIPGTIIRFSLENKSTYNYFDFYIPLIAKQGTIPVAVTFVPIFSLQRNQKISLESRWDYPFTATEFEAVPDIDMLDERLVVPAL